MTRASTTIPYFRVNAFTGSAFGGNPAAVCPLETWLPDELMQRLAAENALSETAFLVPRGEDFELRWFTPAVEVDLCGHATLAAAEVVLRHLEPGREAVAFHTRSGRLEVRAEGERLVMDLPSRRAEPREAGPLAPALGGDPREVFASGGRFLVVYARESDVAALAPDMAGVAAGAPDGAIVTAPGEEADFVSRFFAPSCGVPEDPVCGSAHCTLTPYWSERLGKRELVGHQISARGGVIWCTDRGERVIVAGRAALYLRGEATF